MSVVPCAVTFAFVRPVPLGSTEMISSPGPAMLTHGPHTLNEETAPDCAMDATDSTSSANHAGDDTELTVFGSMLLFCAAQPTPWSLRLPAAVTTTTSLTSTAYRIAACRFRSSALKPLGELQFVSEMLMTLAPLSAARTTAWASVPTLPALARFSGLAALPSNSKRSL